VDGDEEGAFSCLEVDFPEAFFFGCWVGWVFVGECGVAVFFAESGEATEVEGESYFFIGLAVWGDGVDGGVDGVELFALGGDPAGDWLGVVVEVVE